MNAIVDFFVGIYDWVISIFSAVWKWFLDLLLRSINVILEPVVSAIPDMSGVWSHFSVIVPYTAFLNQWIALDFAFQLLEYYFIFILVMIPVKLLIKLFIPGLG